MKMGWSEVYVLLMQYWPQNDCPEEYDSFMEEVCSISGWTLSEIRAQEEADLKALQDAAAVRYEELMTHGLEAFMKGFRNDHQADPLHLSHLADT